METIKAYYYKKNFDHMQGNVDPLKYHETFFFLLKCFGVVDTEPPSRFSKISITFLTIVAFITITLTSFTLYNAARILDLQIITEAGTYILMFTYKLLILSCAKINVQHFYHLLKTLRTDFHYICTERSEYRQKFFENQLVTWQISVLAVIYANLMGVVMIVFCSFVVIYYLITYEEGQEWKRPLFFPFWMWGMDFYKSPLYDIVLVYLMVAIITIGYTYSFILQTHIVWIRHITTKADIITWLIRDLFDEIQPASDAAEEHYYAELIKQRMGPIIEQHLSMYELLGSYTAVYKKLLMFEQKFFGPILCLSAFCTANKLDEGEFNAILFLSCVMVIVNGFIPSYLCTYLRSKVNSICDACWDAKFWNASGKAARPYLVLIMQRSQRSLPLHAAGFEEVSLETFSKKMTTAYSWFNMLRQTNHSASK